ncbi:MAG: DUF3501 family protein [Pseudomonadota bacterium]|jgi:hypothetical protein|nr:hypothetical protein [Nisaea sp.]MDP7379738.1 DUF3501 family protein [Alphaproteobacteria bacterium]MEC7674413.1 DUF3501 family protein [Pseudomonadota bacterium]MEC8007314.1 DUF3501 family protein [Pseudomonadota bacterium]MEC8027367.1 DUF3501 family protein [Pseudomonadota bacterium]|tara:strand:- start:190 stop:780 length:591 start_codon:yes stop_codon:yes gene_type:complete
MTPAKELTRDDIMDMAAYGAIRMERRREIVADKKNRRVHIGPHATFYFENYWTMWLQVHEMLYIEKGGEAQIPDELNAYNPLIPKGRELIATVMFEIDDPAKRAAILGELGGVEETFFLSIDGAEVTATAETDVDRTSAEGKASSVQFVHFHLTDDQAAKLKGGAGEVILGIKHPAYSHMTILPPATRAALAGDLD